MLVRWTAILLVLVIYSAYLYVFIRNWISRKYLSPARQTKTKRITMSFMTCNLSLFIEESTVVVSPTMLWYDLLLVVLFRSLIHLCVFFNQGHYYSYVRPDIRSNEWYRFDDQIVTKVEFNDVVADAYGGRVRRKRSRSLDESKSGSSTKRQRGLLRRIFSFGGRLKNAGDGAFGYGGITSSAYMLQYVRRSDIPTLYLE